MKTDLEDFIDKAKPLEPKKQKLGEKDSTKDSSKDLSIITTKNSGEKSSKVSKEKAAEDMSEDFIKTPTKNSSVSKTSYKTPLPKINIPEIFADPTLDVTFKMLFGSEANKDILISLLNNLLGFKGKREIIEVEINSNELPISVFSNEKTESGITSSVDILCTNKGKQKIAIEMQGQKTKYFLPREQEYMSKLICGQVKEGEGKFYHEKVLETYIIVIGKSNVFIGDTALKDQKIYEIDVQPTVLQTKEVIPNNKMFWKFFELPKFAETKNYKKIDKASPLKEQWLEFLIECSKQKDLPDRNEIIKKGYEIMKVAKWNEDTRALYWKQKVNELAVIEANEESYEKGLEEGEAKGKLKGEIKGEIKQVKSLVKYKVPKEAIITELKFLTDDKLQDKLDYNLKYIGDHLDDYDSDICNELGLVEALGTSSSGYESSGYATE